MLLLSDPSYTLFPFVSVLLHFLLLFFVSWFFLLSSFCFRRIFKILKNDDHSSKGKFGNVQQALTETAGCTLCVAGRHSDLLALSVTEGGAAFCKACNVGRYSTSIGAYKEVTCSK